ncbi:MAG: MFS transporter [Paracoccaceae bacterium]
MVRNVRLYPWFQFFRNLLFWQATWFLFFQETLSAQEAILLYAAFDIATTALEVPSGYLSDRIGRRFTLILAMTATVAGSGLIAIGDSFAVFIAAQALLGAGAAFASGTDSALLYESLDRDGQKDKIEHHEILAWRAGFTGLALSAVIGGVMALSVPALPFVASTITAGIGLAIAVGFREPLKRQDDAPVAAAGRPRTGAFRILAWIFVLSVSMYIFSHVPFVFGQPFILDALGQIGYAADAPLVSGAVTAVMMLVSVATSWSAPGLRDRLGLTGILLLALGLQVVLIAMLGLTNDLWAISLLLLRMVPDSLARPFILARIQPLLSDARRATYLSMQSFCGRLTLAGTLAVAAFGAVSTDMLSFAEIRTILLVYTVAGLVVLVALGATARLARDRA